MIISCPMCQAEQKANPPREPQLCINCGAELDYHVINNACRYFARKRFTSREYNCHLDGYIIINWVQLYPVTWNDSLETTEPRCVFIRLNCGVGQYQFKKYLPIERFLKLLLLI